MAAAGAGLVNPVAGMAGGALVQTLGAGWALFNQRHVKDFLEDWLEHYVELATAADKLRSDADEQRVDLDEQRADLDDLNTTVADLSESLGDAAFATINHILEVVRRTAHEEKMERLRNAALHVALADGPDQPLQDILLSILDVLTVLHVRLLDCLFHPRKYGIDAVNSADFHVVGLGIGGAFKVIQQRVPGFERQDILERCLDDLINQGLVYYQEQGRDARLLGNPLPTTLAHDFMTFITAPDIRPSTGLS